MAGHHANARKITERISINGELVLTTPTHFGNGRVRGDALVDMSLLLDDAEGVGRALIPGATITGALRNYLREQIHGYAEKESRQVATGISHLFGPPSAALDKDKGTGKILQWDQSLLIVDDALARSQDLTLRDGVAINAKTGTAEDSAKFDVELLEAGAIFDLHFDLLLTEQQRAEQLLPYVAAALQGLESGEIRLGLRKRRGYGQCCVKRWTVSRYDLTNPADLCEWLETPTTGQRTEAISHAHIAQVLNATPLQEEDQRRQFKLLATFGLAGSSVLIRSGFGEADSGPDMEHLHALNTQGKRVPVISGTSWAGVIRHRALRIANTLAGANSAAEARAAEIVNRLFGDMPEGALRGQASKVTVDETQVQHGQSLYQTRVRIDRFTGGAFPTALFEQAPVYGRPETVINFALHVRNPESYETGLLLLVLKDLWTSDLSVGGEASVGRGRLQGIQASLLLPDQAPVELDQAQPALGLTVEQRAELERPVAALWNKLHQPREETNGAE